MNKIYLNIITALSLCGLMACSEDIPDTVTDNSGDNSITLSFFSETDATATRSDFYGSASQVNQLIYMIYKLDNQTNEYRPDSYFLNNNYYDAQKYDENGMPDGSNYTRLPYCGVLNDKSSPFTIRLVPNPADKGNPDQMYKIVCWAQKKDSPYFDLTNFPDRISMNYGAIPNNEEELDAFYGVAEFKASASKVTINLKRPFAQINIGTPGWDYEGFASIEPTAKIIKFSTIKIKGVAKSFSPINKRADTKINGVENDNLTTLTYDWAILPAYRQLKILKEESLDEITGVYEYDKKAGIYTDVIKEEFLEIDLPDPENDDEKGKDIEDIDSANGHFTEHDGYNNGFADYIGWKEYDALCAQYVDRELVDKIFTETFKYLSMCYVLIPFEENEKGEVSSGSTVTVTFDCSVGPKVPENTDEDESSVSTEVPVQPVYESVLGDKKIFEIANVPVKCNNRTNIVATDGSGFFMNSNEIRVSIHTQTFADYYKHQHAIDEYWDREEEKDYDPENPGYHGESGDKFDNDYQWPDGSTNQPSDFDPDLGKWHINIPKLEDLSMTYNNQSYTCGDINNLVVDLYRYTDQSVTFTFDLYDGVSRYSSYSNSIEKNNLSFTCYIGERELGDIKVPLKDDQNNDVENKYTFTVKMKDLVDQIDTQQIQPHKTVLTEYVTYYDKDSNIPEKDVNNNNKLRVVKYTDLPALKYYPIEFKLKTNFIEPNHKIKVNDVVVTINVHYSYIYTFTSTSTDDGGDIWKKITGKKGSGSDDALEKASYYIDDQASVVSNSGKIVATSRKGVGNNHRLFAIKDSENGDRLRFKGCNGYGGNLGHWIIFPHLRENCNITAKVGRDEKQDNSTYENSQQRIYSRGLHIDWGQETGIGNESDRHDEWIGYDPTKSEFLSGGGTSSSKFLFNETHIMRGKTGFTENFETGKTTDVKIYIDTSGHSYYWIILSEPDNN